MCNNNRGMDLSTLQHVLIWALVINFGILLVWFAVFSLAPIPLAAHLLERRAWLEHGIHMPDEQHPGGAGRAFVAGEQMPRTPRCRLVHAFDGEAQRLQLGHQHLAHRAHAFVVMRAGILRHQPFE